MDRVVLNYPCPVTQLSSVRHNKTKHRENRICEWSYFYLCCPCRSQHTCGSWMETGPPGGPGAAIDVFGVDGGHSQTSVTAPPGGLPSMFFALMVGTPDPSAPPSRGPPSTFFALMVGAHGPWAMPPRGPVVDVFCVDSGHSRTSGIASQGAHHQCFLR
jgi:hypothetical protein